MSDDTSYTPEQVADWRRYEKVRQGGRFNMLDRRARKLTGLSGERYGFCLQNYLGLKAAAEQAIQP